MDVYLYLQQAVIKYNGMLYYDKYIIKREQIPTFYVYALNLPLAI